MAGRPAYATRPVAGDALPWHALSRRRAGAWVSAIVRVDADDPSLRRRGQILAFLSLPLFLIGASFLVVDFMGWLMPLSEHAVYNMVTDLTFSAVIAGTWLLNRRGHVTLAAVCQLCCVSAGLVFFFYYTSPYRIEILFVQPVVVAAFVLRPWAAFVWAGVSSASFVALNAAQGGEQRLNLQVSLALFGLAIIAWLVASCLEWTVTSLYHTSMALEQDVAAREKAEEARRQVEAALAVSQQQSRTLFEESSLGVFLFDGQLVVTECNERLAAQLQVTRQSLVGTDFGMSRELCLVPAMEAAVNGAVGSYDGPYRVEGAGDDLWISFTASPLRGAASEVIGGIGVVTDLTDRKQAEELIQRLAYRDAVTGLPNRSLFRDRVERAVAAAERHGHKLAVGVLDIDRFKTVNDTLGHAQGDRLLTGVAERLSSLLRDSDSAARSGGDEFLFLLTDVASARDAALAADRMLISLRRPWDFDGTRFYVSGSVGLALYPDDGNGAQALLENAHTAMRRVKQSGGDGQQFYDHAVTALADERLALESELHGAFDARQFTVYYQPQVDTATGEVVGAEALVRWRHPNRGLLLPAEFITLAEETGLIVRLGQFVLREACVRAKAWQELFSHPLRMAVNVSARQLREPGLITDVRRALQESGLDPALLELEITETAALAQVGHADSVLRRLRDMGVSVALDDFGTGYSSLSQLRRLPVTRLKIDRSFVGELPGDESSAAIVGTVIDLARAVGLGVVAEGVETDEQLAFLEARGCYEVQGFLISPPLPAEEWGPAFSGKPFGPAGRAQSHASALVDAAARDKK